MTGDGPGGVAFEAHIDLLRLFLTHREQIVERIQEILNAQRKPSPYLQDGPLLSRLFEDCFFKLPAIGHDQSRLRGQLQEAHWSSGFLPREMPGVHNDLVDPAQMMIRGFHLWQRTRWPGRPGRIRYAHTLFSVQMLRYLELLSMRMWDAGSGSADDRLAHIQSVLDDLWKSRPPDQPALVRDARWLVPLAQSPTTYELAPYFEVAAQVAGSLSEENRIEIHKASVQMAGGHLRSQLRHYCIKKGVTLEENSLVLNARNSNALDFAITIQNLVPLLEAYERATHNSKRRGRLELASAIFQGISPDPELFVNYRGLLGAYSMIEQLFISTDGGQVAYTPMGKRHLRLLQEYAAQIARLCKPLYDDLPSFRPTDGSYSPYGVIYGFSSNLTEHMVLKTLQPNAATQFSLEDVFTDGEAHTGKRDWVSGWRKLPHIKQEVQALFDYPQQFAEDIFDRIERALRRAVADAAANAGAQTGRLFILSTEDVVDDSPAAQLPDLPRQYIGSSDTQSVAAQRAHSYDETQLLRDRQEGMFLVSYQTSDGWTAITKDVLTDVLGAGTDVKVTGLPKTAAAVLRLMAPDLVRDP